MFTSAFGCCGAENDTLSSSLSLQQVMNRHDTASSISNATLLMINTVILERTDGGGQSPGLEYAYTWIA